MTTQPAIQGPCSTDHEHGPACDAAFWREVMGCDVEIRGPRHRYQSGTRYVCTDWGAWGWKHGGMAGRHHEIAPILSDPSADSSWLAMRDVLAEMERRGGLEQLRFVAELDHLSGAPPMVNARLVLLRVVENLTPSMVALAAWSAVKGES